MARRTLPAHTPTSPRSIVPGGSDLSPSTFLDDNDAVNFFDPLGDLIRLGRTDTNVGDLQVYLSAGSLGT